MRDIGRLTDSSTPCTAYAACCFFNRSSSTCRQQVLSDQVGRWNTVSSSDLLEVPIDSYVDPIRVLYLDSFLPSISDSLYRNKVQKLKKMKVRLEK